MSKSDRIQNKGSIKEKKIQTNFFFNFYFLFEIIYIYRHINNKQTLTKIWNQ